jgi:hypothetical protein
MGLYQAIDLLASEWDGIRPELNDGTLAELVELVAQLGTEPVPEFAVEIVEQIVVLLSGSLPVGHPFRDALRRPENRWSQGVTHDVGELTTLLAMSETLLGKVVPDYSLPTMEEVRRGASAWLLAENSFSETELRERGQDPADPDLIQLDREDGIRQWPAFQFDHTGKPLELVRMINRILGIQDDPWGVADWWLGGNVWLRGVPAELIGQVDDQDLIDAAQGELAER